MKRPGRTKRRLAGAALAALLAGGAEGAPGQDPAAAGSVPAPFGALAAAPGAGPFAGDVPCRLREGKIRVDVRCSLVLAVQRNLDIQDQQAALRSARRGEWLAGRDFVVKVTPGAVASTSSSATAVTQAGVTSSLDAFRAGVGLSRKFTTGTSVSAEPFYEDVAGFRSTGLAGSLTQPLLRGISPTYNRAGLDSAIAQAKAAAWNREAALSNTLAGIVEQLLGWWESRERLAVYEESLKAFEARVHVTEARQRVGLATSLDVYRVQIERTSLREQVESAADVSGVAADRFLFSLSLAPDTPLEPLVERFGGPDFTLEADLETAAQRRPEVKVAQDAVADAERRVRVSRHALLPDLSVVLGFEYRDYRSQPPDALVPDATRWLFSLRTSTDVARDSERAALQDALDQVDAARRNLSRTRQRVRDEVRSALRSLERSRRQVTIQEEQIRQASSKLAVAEAKFRNGLASNFDLLEAEGELRNARTTLLSVRREALAGVHRVMVARGTYLDWIREEYGIETAGL